MSFKSKMLAGAASLALVGGVAVAGGLSANAATPSCGHNCIDIFNRQFGTYRSPNFVMDVFRQGARVGQPIILFRTSNSDPAEDFTVSLQGNVSDFFAAGLVSSAVALHYGGLAVGADDDAAYELEYAPYGVDSGLCVGVQATAMQGEHVTLQPCGVSAKTVWIVDDGGSNFDTGVSLGDSPRTSPFYVPLINGSDTNFSHPFVLDYPHNGYPTDIPRPQLQVRNLTGFSNGHGPIVGTVIDTQLWGAVFGQLR
jgi:hypothetical protein